MINVKAIKLRLIVFQGAVALLIMSGCVSRPDRLEYALEFAGKNRTELEKVLEHYKGDAMKYRAACFLIENMPRWYSYDGWQLDTLHALLEKQLSCSCQICKVCTAYWTDTDC